MTLFETLKTGLRWGLWWSFWPALREGYPNGALLLRVRPDQTEGTHTFALAERDVVEHTFQLDEITEQLPEVCARILAWYRAGIDPGLNGDLTDEGPTRQREETLASATAAIVAFPPPPASPDAVLMLATTLGLDIDLMPRIIEGQQGLDIMIEYDPMETPEPPPSWLDELDHVNEEMTVDQLSAGALEHAMRSAAKP